MNDSPFFSVVMPVFNADRYLEPAIESVLKQSHMAFEFVIVDDGSTDGSFEICKVAAARDSRLKLIHQPNAGPGVAMNAAIAMTAGNWIVVMHADDLMVPERLEILASHLPKEGSRIGIITSSVELIGANGESLGMARPELPTNPFFLGNDNSDYIVGGLYHPAVVISKTALDEVGGYDPSCRVNEDVELFNRLVEHGFGIKILTETLLKYRIHSGAASAAKDRNLLLHWRYLKTVIRLRRQGSSSLSWEEFLQGRKKMPFHLKFNEWRKDSAKMCYRRAASALSAGQKPKFAAYAFFSAVLQPTFIFGRWRKRRK